MVYFHFYPIDMVIRQVFRTNDLLMGRLNRHFLLQVTFGLWKFLALIDELALIFIFGETAISVPGVYIFNTRR